MKIFARHALSRQNPRFDTDALLLEGTWPHGASGVNRYSLDESIDARFDWIDLEAVRLAQLAAGGDATSVESVLIDPGRTLAYLNALKLRYWFVKMLRVVAFFEQIPQRRKRAAVELHLEQRRDDDYALLFAQLCETHCIALEIRSTAHSKREEPRAARCGLVRRWAAWMEKRRELRCDLDSENRTRVVLCGNPALLDPICRALVERGSQVRWLYDRFAFRSFARWNWSGVRQLLCDANEGVANRFAEAPQLRGLHSRGIDLSAAASSFLADCRRRYGARQTQLLRALDEHFSRFCPHALVLDEDTTPKARAAVLVARCHGVKSVVVQHGAPCVRFGFAPLAADRFFAWGETSRQQLIRWGITPQRVEAIGSPKHDRLLSRFAARRLPERRRHGRAKRPLILVLDNTLPRDDRPDAVSFRLTRTTHSDILRMVCATVGRIDDAQLAVRLHPRSPNDIAWREVLSEFPHLRVRWTGRGDFARWARRADCVLSCASGAGIEAALMGIPVVQLLPAGSGNVLPAEEWGLLGTARNASELEPLLSRALSTKHGAPRTQLAQVVANFRRPAGETLADALLAHCAGLGSVDASSSNVCIAPPSGAIPEPTGHRG